MSFRALGREMPAGSSHPRSAPSRSATSKRAAGGPENFRSLVDDTLLCDLSDKGTSTNCAHPTRMAILTRVPARRDPPHTAVHIAIPYALPYCEKRDGSNFYITVFELFFYDTQPMLRRRMTHRILWTSPQRCLQDRHLCERGCAGSGPPSWPSRLDLWQPSAFWAQHRHRFCRHLPARRGVRVVRGIAS